VDTARGGDGAAAWDGALADVGAELAEAVAAAVPGWVERSVLHLVRAWSGAVPPHVAAEARAAGAAAGREVGDGLRALLGAGVDDQWTNPMTIVRRAVPHAAGVLERAGVGDVERSAEDEAHHPADRYGLTPQTFADVDPSLHDLGIRWGATKARAHLARHRPAGRGT
jgi:hypothetical protein